MLVDGQNTARLSISEQRRVREEAKPKSSRVAALDLLRGLAVAGMIVVDSPGNWQISYAPLQHAAWNGWTPTDMIFPAFLFCVGMAWAFSFPRNASGLPAIWYAAARRTLLLVLIGIFLNALPDFDLVHLRFPGILQRIAFCYFSVVVLTLLTARREDGMLQLNLVPVAIAAAALLVAYWAMLRFIPVPGFGPGHLDSLRALPAWIDRSIFTSNHMWDQGTTPGVGVTYDPEGLVSTLGAVASCLIGILAAAAFRALPERRRILCFAIAGAALIGAGYLLSPFLPFNKRLWTSSFVLLSGGVSLLALAVLIVLPSKGGAATLTHPLKLLGANAILAFVLSQILGAISELKIVLSSTGPTTPQKWGYSVATSLIPDPYLASLACAVGILALIVLAIAPLHRRGIFLRV